jgi:thiosulfate/3-mercaptopyruvate sulfurtransferase
MRQLRIRKTDDILLYDHMGFFSVGRIAFMFRYFGAKKVRIINGGLKKWKLEGKPTYGGDYVAGEGLEAEGDYSY